MPVDVLSSLKRSRYRYLIAGGVFLTGAALIGILFFHNPETVSWYPPCMFHEATGLYCFGCGNTRALYWLVHGDIAGSLRKNLLLVPAVVFLFYSIWKPQLVTRPKILYTVTFIVIAFTVCRNLPWVPFTFLAPH